jgi:flagellar protein FlgJ
MKSLMPLPLSSLKIRMEQSRDLPDAKGKGDEAKLREAANEFEAIFIQQMLKTMRKTSLESEFIKKSEGEKIFRSMLDEQYAIISAKSGSLGLGEMIFQQLRSNLGK